MLTNPVAAAFLATVLDSEVDTNRTSLTIHTYRFFTTVSPAVAER